MEKIRHRLSFPFELFFVGNGLVRAASADARVRAVRRDLIWRGLDNFAQHALFAADHVRGLENPDGLSRKDIFDLDRSRIRRWDDEPPVGERHRYRKTIPYDWFFFHAVRRRSVRSVFGTVRFL